MIKIYDYDFDEYLPEEFETIEEAEIRRIDEFKQFLLSGGDERYEDFCKHLIIEVE